MTREILSALRGWALLGAVAAVAGVASPVHAQGFLDDDGGLDDGPDVIFQDQILEREYASDTPLMDYDGRYIVVHLGENRVFLFEGGRAIWSAPAGTGTGFRLDGQSAEHRWKFDTPRGLMKVRRMEKDPVWEAPDWHYLERGQRPPAPNSPRRKIRGGMGNTALYLGDGIAIHGTWRPGLLLTDDPEARRVSHGCIRLTDEHARELMHMVDVGTPVLIF
ncbi:MAG: L,D-transpeptidase [Gemmatimonadota bacterium]|jgi:lipoprotein-anchoring transpeptidase ErfK/SrfK